MAEHDEMGRNRTGSRAMPIEYMMTASSYCAPASARFPFSFASCALLGSGWCFSFTPVSTINVDQPTFTRDHLRQARNHHSQHVYLHASSRLARMSTDVRMAHIAVIPNVVQSPLRRLAQQAADGSHHEPGLRARDQLGAVRDHGSTCVAPSPRGSGMSGGIRSWFSSKTFITEWEVMGRGGSLSAPIFCRKVETGRMM